MHNVFCFFIFAIQKDTLKFCMKVELTWIKMTAKTTKTIHGCNYFMFRQQGSYKSQKIIIQNTSVCFHICFPEFPLPGAQWVKILCLILKSEKVALQCSSLSESCSIQKRPWKWERSEQPRYWKRGLLASTISLSNKMLPPSRPSAFY